MKGEVVTEEYPVQSEAGLRLYMARRVAVLDEKSQPQYLIQTNEDITDRRQTESRMAHMAYHDGLTDLPNRVAFVQALSQMIDACAGSDEFAVLSIDLDRFKEVNDVFGHDIGDKVLIEASRRIQSSAQGAVVARLSGDEFGLIIDGPQPEAGRALAERLIEAMQKEFVHRRQDRPHRRDGRRRGVPAQRTMPPPRCWRMPMLRCSAPRPARADRFACSRPRWISRSATGARCIASCRRRSRTAS